MSQRFTDTPPNTQGLHLHLSDGKPLSNAEQMPIQQLIAIWHQITEGMTIQVYENHEEIQLQYEGKVFEKHISHQEDSQEYHLGIDGLRFNDGLHRGYVFNLKEVIAIVIKEKPVILDMDQVFYEPDDTTFQESEDFFATQPRHREQQPEEEQQLPLLPDGNVDQFLIMIRYAIEHQPLETPEEFKKRIGVKQYLTDNRNKSEQHPQIWNTLTLVIPEAIAEIYKNWFDKFLEHNLPFDQWWTQIGQLDIVIEDQNGIAQPAGQHLRDKVDEMTERASSYIDQTPPSMKDRLLHLYGIWAYTLTKTQFTPFEVFANQDQEYIRLYHDHESRTNNGQEGIEAELPWTTFMSNSMSTDITGQQIADYLVPDQDIDDTHVELLLTEGNVFLQTMVDKKCEITKADFMPGGRLSHVYIPNYSYVPPMAIEILTGDRSLTKSEYPLLHRRLLRGRKDAAMDCEDLDTHLWAEVNNPAPDLQTIWGYVTQNSLVWNGMTTQVDEVQHFTAHSKIQDLLNKKDKKERVRDLYDSFIRPMERLFGRDMPFSKELLLSINDPVKQTWINRQLNHIAGIPQNVLTIDEQSIQEVSRIRHLSSQQIQQDYNDDPKPPQRLPAINFTAPERKRINYHATSWNELAPKAEDFYPQGRLHGLFIDPTQPIQDYLYKRFSNRPRTDKSAQIILHEIVMAKAEWSKQVITQLKIQTGMAVAATKAATELPTWLEKPKDFPNWIKNVTTSLIGSEKPKKEKTPFILPSLEDFQPNGLLHGTQQQTIHTIEQDVIAKFGQSGRIKKTAQKKLVARVNKIISIMEPAKAQTSEAQQTMSHIKQTTAQLANQATNLITNMMPQNKKTPPSHTITAPKKKEEKDTKIIVSKTDSGPQLKTRQLSNEQIKATKMIRLPNLQPIPEEIKQEVISEPDDFDWSDTQPLFPTDWSQQMDEEDEQTQQVEIVKYDSKHPRPDSESPQIPQKRRMEQPSTSAQANWIKKEDTKNVQAPPQQPQSQPPFQQTQRRKPINPFHWNGNPKYVPDWAKSPQSANDIGYVTQNTVPAEQKSRVHIARQMRMFPTDGVHRIQNITIQRDPTTKNLPMNKADREAWMSTLQILITSQSKDRHQSMQLTEPTNMLIPTNDWKAVKALLIQLRQTILPPAQNDEHVSERLIILTMKGESHTYMADVRITFGPRGSERLTRIVQTNDGDLQLKGFSFPWRFTVMFADKWSATVEEISKDSNEQFRKAITQEKTQKLQTEVPKTCNCTQSMPKKESSNPATNIE